MREACGLAPYTSLASNPARICWHHAGYDGILSDAAAELGGEGCKVSG